MSSGTRRSSSGTRKPPKLVSSGLMLSSRRKTSVSPQERIWRPKRMKQLLDLGLEVGLEEALAVAPTSVRSRCARLADVGELAAENGGTRSWL